MTTFITENILLDFFLISYKFTIKLCDGFVKEILELHTQLINQKVNPQNQQLNTLNLSGIGF